MADEQQTQQTSEQQQSATETQQTQEQTTTEQTTQQTQRQDTAGPKIPADIQRAFPEVQTEEDYKLFLEQGPTLFREGLTGRVKAKEAQEAEASTDADFQAIEGFNDQMKQYAAQFKKRYGRDMTATDAIFVLMREKAKQDAKGKADPKEIDRKIDGTVEYKLFWKDPQVADLGKDARAKRLVHDLVNNEKMDPLEAAAEVRKMLNKPAPKPKTERDTELPPWMHLEGSPEGPESGGGRNKLQKALSFIQKLEEKPPGERGSDNYYNVWARTSP